MVLPAVAAPVRTEAVGSAATVGGTLQAAAASAGRTRGGPPAADSCTMGCSGAASPVHPPSPAVDKSRAAGGPALQLAMANELITRLAMAQEKRTLSDLELSLVKSLLDRIPVLEAAVGARGGAHSPRWGFKVAAPLRLAWLLRRSAEERGAAPCRSPSSPSSEEPLTPEILLEIAKEVISQLVKAQEKRMLSAAEHSLIKLLEDRIPGLEAASGVCGGETQSLSKVASSCLARAKARRVLAATFSALDSRSPGLSMPMVHPLSHQDDTQAAHVTVGRQIITKHSGEEDAHSTSAVHKMSDANFSHEHHRGGQELSSDHESFSEKLNSGCDLGVVTEKSSTTIAPEMAPPTSDGDNTAESSGISNRWGAPDAEGFDDFGLPDDLGLY